MDRKERNKFIVENLRLAYYAAEKYRKSSFPYDDVLGACFLGLVKAAETFDKEKSSFTTYAMKVMVNEVRLFIRGENKKSGYSFQSIDAQLDNGVIVADAIPDKRDYFENVLAWDSFDAWIQSLDGKERDVVTLSASGLTQLQIAKEIGISQSYVSRILRAAKGKLKRKLCV